MIPRAWSSFLRSDSAPMSQGTKMRLASLTQVDGLHSKLVPGANSRQLRSKNIN